MEFPYPPESFISREVFWNICNLIEALDVLFSEIFTWNNFVFNRREIMEITV
jgi:hypothetical protein